MANNQPGQGRPTRKGDQSKLPTRAELLAPEWTLGSAPIPASQALNDIRANFNGFHQVIDARMALHRAGTTNELRPDDSISNVGLSDVSYSSYNSEKHRRLAEKVVDLMDENGALIKGGRQDAGTRAQLRDAIARIISDDKRRRREAIDELEKIRKAQGSLTHPGDLRIDEGNPISVPPARKEFHPLPAIVEEGRPDPKPTLDHIRIPLHKNDPLYAERIRLQLARMTMQANGVRLSIPDQGIRFDGFTPYAVEPINSPGGTPNPSNESMRDDSQYLMGNMGPSVSQRHIQVPGNDNGTNSARWGEYYDGDNPYGATVVTRPRVGFADPIHDTASSPNEQSGRISVIRDLAGSDTPEGEFLDRKSNDIRAIIRRELSVVVPGVTGPDKGGPAFI